MNHRSFGYIFCLLATLLIGMTVAACGAKDESGTAAGSVLGTYESVHLGMVIKLESDNKATLVDEGQSTDVTWEMSGDHQLVIHGMEGMTFTYNINQDGSLSDAMGLGSVYRKK